MIENEPTTADLVNGAAAPADLVVGPLEVSIDPATGAGTAIDTDTGETFEVTAADADTLKALKELEENELPPAASTLEVAMHVMTDEALDGLSIVQLEATLATFSEQVIRVRAEIVRVKDKLHSRLRTAQVLAKARVDMAPDTIRITPGVIIADLARPFVRDKA